MPTAGPLFPILDVGETRNDDVSRARIALYCLLAGVVGMVIGSRAWNAYTRPPGVSAAPAGAPAAVQTSGSFAPIVDRDLPAVVNVSSSKVVRGYGYWHVAVHDGSLLSPVLRRRFRRPQQQYRGMPGGGRQTQKSLGSGVIVKSDGYIITNNHVIDGATDVRVTLLDKREFKAQRDRRRFEDGYRGFEDRRQGSAGAALGRFE